MHANGENDQGEERCDAEDRHPSEGKDFVEFDHVCSDRFGRSLVFSELTVLVKQ